MLFSSIWGKCPGRNVLDPGNCQYPLALRLTPSVHSDSYRALL